jgi:hypothetical protein
MGLAIISIRLARKVDRLPGQALSGGLFALVLKRLVEVFFPSHAPGFLILAETIIILFFSLLLILCSEAFICSGPLLRRC